MKKSLFILMCTLFLTGCSLEYEINFNEDIIQENIKATFDGNINKQAPELTGDGFYLEKEIVENKIPSLKNKEDYYTKKINANDKISNVYLNYNYTYDQFERSYFTDYCFENSYINNTDDYIYVSLDGQFNCHYEEDIKIKLSTSYKMAEHNADEYKDGYYIWNLKMTDEENNITFMIKKEPATTNQKQIINTTTDIVFLVISIIITISIIIIIFKRKKDNNDN